MLVRHAGSHAMDNSVSLFAASLAGRAETSVVHGQLASAEARPGDRVNRSAVKELLDHLEELAQSLAPMALGVMAARPSMETPPESRPQRR